MVPVNTEILLVDARVALRRRLADSCRTDLSQAFAAWLLREPAVKAEFVSIIYEAGASSPWWKWHFSRGAQSLVRQG